METYYVVKKGHRTGIFKTWPECKSAVEGFTNPVYKKFTSFQEASEFMKNGPTSYIARSGNSSGNSSGSSSSVTPAFKKPNTINMIGNANTASSADMVKIKAMATNIKSSQFSDELNYNVKGWTIIDDEIYIFTDGSSRKSKDYFNSGIGVYIGYQCTNIKEQYNDKTNNQCELMAMDYAFKLIVRYYRELSEIGKVIKIVSDSEYSIKACSVWLTSWKTNHWKTSKGEDVKNKELIESIDGSMQRIKIINSKFETDKKIRVKLIHINSHQPPDMSDKFKFSIWFGNYIADALAQNTV